MTNKPRFSMTMDKELLEEVKTYQYKHGISTQNKAIQQLVRIGIGNLEARKAPSSTQSGNQEQARDEQERELIRLSRRSDDTHRRLAVQILQASIANSTV